MLSAKSGKSRKEKKRRGRKKGEWKGVCEGERKEGKEEGVDTKRKKRCGGIVKIEGRNEEKRKMRQDARQVRISFERPGPAKQSRARQDKIG
eukprot:752236-Hanusia_phi.AAC.3